jgi:hypothetical protein
MITNTSVLVNSGFLLYNMWEDNTYAVMRQNFFDGRSRKTYKLKSFSFASPQNAGMRRFR